MKDKINVIVGIALMFFLFILLAGTIQVTGKVPWRLDIPPTTNIESHYENGKIWISIDPGEKGCYKFVNLYAIRARSTPYRLYTIKMPCDGFKCREPVSRYYYTGALANGTYYIQTLDYDSYKYAKGYFPVTV